MAPHSRGPSKAADAANNQMENSIKDKIALYGARIERGIKWLNKNKPGWLKKINLKLLDLSSQDRCILGQAYEDFWNKVVSEGEIPEKGQINFLRAVALGFALDDSDYAENEGKNYDLLTAMWFSRLTALRAGCK